ncbi:ribosome maturation factor RimM [Sphingomonas zeicaulis]|uniref:ribosome maturation factor RimM n=1 Tax=Sphingomonas zeicaulis TaxID=1632740 RepID=UPI003D205D20
MSVDASSSPAAPASGRGDAPVTLAAIIGAHGITGEVRLKLFGDGPEGLRAYAAFDAAGRTLTLKSVRPGPNGAVARFAEITDRNAAEALRGVALTVPRSAMPALGEGEYYHVDLIGLPAVSTEGEALGTVVAVENFGAGDVVEIERPTGKRFMVPMQPDAVPEWNDKHLMVTAAFAAE